MKGRLRLKNLRKTVAVSSAPPKEMASIFAVWRRASASFAFRRALLTAGLIVLTLAAGTVGFNLLEGYSFFDAFYMTLITITTVGYQEIRPLDHAGRIFNSFLIFFGVCAMFVAVGAMTQSIIELELQDRYGKRRKRRMIRDLRNHFIVCGYGRVGRSASAEFLHANVPIILIDKNSQRVEKATEAGLLAFEADATRDDCLREAGIMQARGLIAALPSDAENLFIILSAKTLNPKLTVVTRASEEEAEQKLRRAGADLVFAPYTMAGRRLAHSLLRPHVVEFLDFGTTDKVGPKIMVEQVQVAAGSPLIGRPLADMLARELANVIVLAVRNGGGEMLFNPPGNFVISAGDVLIVMGERPDLGRLESSLTRSKSR